MSARESLRYFLRAGLSALDYLEVLEAEWAASRGAREARRPGASSRSWWRVLGFTSAPSTLTAAERAYRERVLTCHPDRPGGSVAAFHELRSALEEARADAA